MTFSADEIYSVSRFIQLCQQTVSQHIPSCYVEGEISNLSRPASGHWYFSLKDKNAQIRCAMFRLSQRNISFDLENGMSVIVRGHCAFYQMRGDFQLIVEHVDAAGIGNLQRAYEQLKQKLAKEGLFDAAHKKPLPPNPSKIGVITSRHGAVIRDILTILARRHPSALVLVFDTITQGDKCADKVARAIKRADHRDCDVLIVARGGGSLEDLFGFNDEHLARTIFATKTPIISAIGHETDVTICDFVCDMRAPTPSVAAELASPDRLAQLNMINKHQQHMAHLIKQHLDRCHYALTQQLNSMPDIGAMVRQLQQNIDALSMLLTQQWQRQIMSLNTRLIQQSERLKRLSPNARIQARQQQRQYLALRLKQKIKHRIADADQDLAILNTRLAQQIVQCHRHQQQKLARLTVALDHLSPINVLARGYSISFDADKRVIKSVVGVRANQPITTQLSDGFVDSIVTRVDAKAPISPDDAD